MPMHDWTRVDAGIFHDFHTVWTSEIRTALNEGILPAGYYALAEQHAGAAIADILTLHASDTETVESSGDASSGGIAVMEAPPRVRIRQNIARNLRRTVAIRHVTRHRLVALLEIVSPANKDRRDHVTSFAEKVRDAMNAGIHVLVIDPFPPGAADPRGMHGAIRDLLDGADEPPYAPPPAEPLTLAAYAAASAGVEVYLEQARVGALIPEMPLFLRSDRYVKSPLEETYMAAYRGVPSFWRNVLEGSAPAL